MPRPEDIVDTCGTGGTAAGPSTCRPSPPWWWRARGRGCASTGAAPPRRRRARPTSSRPSVWSSTSGLWVWRAASKRPAWASASRRAFIPPCASPSRCGASSASPTVFNFLGPLANPARAQLQVVGVSDPAMADKMLGVLVANGCQRAMVVHGADGLDELSTTGPSTVLDVGADAEVRRYTVDPSDLGLPVASLDALRGRRRPRNARWYARPGRQEGPAPRHRRPQRRRRPRSGRDQRRPGGGSRAGRCGHRRRCCARRAREAGACLGEAARAAAESS